jgi:hypothetical protein
MRTGLLTIQCMFECLSDRRTHRAGALVDKLFLEDLIVLGRYDFISILTVILPGHPKGENPLIV